MDSQWLFESAMLRSTASIAHCSISLDEELYDRAKGVEFLFRLGGSLLLPTSAMLTAATWFHRFYMRCSFQDYPREHVAAAAIFLATKTDECGRKLRDVARVMCSKMTGIDAQQVVMESPEAIACQTIILRTEEALLEALCFDLVVDNCHAHLVDLLGASDADDPTVDYAWSIANDSYRTPLCILYRPKIIAVACYVLAQKVAEGPNSTSLDARIAFEPPSSSLPTPPTHKPTSPDPTRFAVDHLSLGPADLGQVADALRVMLEFFGAQDLQGSASHLSMLSCIIPPGVPDPSFRMFKALSHAEPPVPSSGLALNATNNAPLGRTPTSSHGGDSPVRASHLSSNGASDQND